MPLTIQPCFFYGNRAGLSWVHDLRARFGGEFVDAFEQTPIPVQAWWRFRGAHWWSMPDLVASLQLVKEQETARAVVVAVTLRAAQRGFYVKPPQDPKCFAAARAVLAATARWVEDPTEVHREAALQAAVTANDVYFRGEYRVGHELHAAQCPAFCLAEQVWQGDADGLSEHFTQTCLTGLHLVATLQAPGRAERLRQFNDLHHAVERLAPVPPINLWSA